MHRQWRSISIIVLRSRTMTGSVILANTFSAESKSGLALFRKDKTSLASRALPSGSGAPRLRASSIEKSSYMFLY